MLNVVLMFNRRIMRRVDEIILLVINDIERAPAWAWAALGFALMITMSAVKY